MLSTSIVIVISSSSMLASFSEQQEIIIVEIGAMHFFFFSTQFVNNLFEGLCRAAQWYSPYRPSFIHQRPSENQISICAHSWTINFKNGLHCKWSRTILSFLPLYCLLRGCILLLGNHAMVECVHIRRLKIHFTNEHQNEANKFIALNAHNHHL